MKQIELIRQPTEKAPAFAVRQVCEDDLKHHCFVRGDVFITLKDGRTGRIQDHRELRNLVVLDASILLARLCKDNAEPPHGFYALALGTGDTGWGITPPAATDTQRSLYSEVARKTFSNTEFIDAAGVPSPVPTNVIDLTTVFSEAEAVAPLKEMGILGGNINTNMSVRKPVLPPNGPRDLSVDLTLFDTLCNYLTYDLISKPATSTLTITWRLTF